MADESQRVAELLDHIQRGDERRFNDFCEALKRSGQQHIVDMLCGNQAAGDATDAVRHDADDMPLSPESGCKLTRKWNYLIDKMNSDQSLLGKLEKLEVFSDLQIRKLKASN